MNADSTVAEKVATPADVLEIIKRAYPAQDPFQFFANIRGELTNGGMPNQSEYYPRLVAQEPVSHSRLRTMPIDHERKPGP
jgi:hypothetical protein